MIFLSAIPVNLTAKRMTGVFSLLYRQKPFLQANHEDMLRYIAIAVFLKTQQFQGFRPSVSCMATWFRRFDTMETMSASMFPCKLARVKKCKNLSNQYEHALKLT